MFERFKLARRITDLEEGFAKVSRDFKNLEAEWNNAWDKLRRMMQRVAKRAEVAERESEPEEIQVATNGAESPQSGRLSPNQKSIQQSILRRRAGM